MLKSSSVESKLAHQIWLMGCLAAVEQVFASLTWIQRGYPPSRNGQHSIRFAPLAPGDGPQCNQRQRNPLPFTVVMGQETHPCQLEQASPWPQDQGSPIRGMFVRLQKLFVNRVQDKAPVCSIHDGHLQTTLIHRAISVSCYYYQYQPSSHRLPNF